MEKFDEKLVKKAYKLISKKYSTENGKKFILHLISSFVLNDKSLISLDNEDDNEIKELECCITRVKVTPKDTPVPLSSESYYYGFKSSKSDKVISCEALEALNRFIMNRSMSGDDVIRRIENYINKKNSPKPSSKNSYPKNKVAKKSNAKYEDTQAIPAPDSPTV